jgi:hypothetical protein
VASRVESIASGEYTRLFGTKGVTIAYATTGERPEYVKTRLRSMRVWCVLAWKKGSVAHCVPVRRFPRAPPHRESASDVPP